MKLGMLNLNVMLFELRAQIGELLAESISDYLSLVVARLKSKTKEELFLPGAYKLDLDQLAEVIAGLKILSNAEHRETMTKDDIGINPNSYKDLYTLLKSVPRDGKNLPRLTGDVFTALKGIAPSIFKKTRQELEILETGSTGERKNLIDKISKFSTEINQMFYKVKHGVTQPKGETKASTDIETAYDEVGGAPI